MSDNSRIAAFEERANAIRWGVYDMCDAAGIAASTFIRWKNGDSRATESSLDKIAIALDQEERRLHQYLCAIVS